MSDDTLIEVQKWQLQRKLHSQPLLPWEGRWEPRENLQMEPKSRMGKRRKGLRTLMIPTLISFPTAHIFFNSVKHTFILSCLVSSGISCVCQVIDTTNLLSILVSINLKSAEISGFHSYHKFHHLYCNFTNSQKNLNHSPKFPKFPKEKCEVSAVWQAGIRS